MKIDWIADNAKWIFSGVGVGGLAWLGSLLTRKSRDRGDGQPNVPPVILDLDHLKASVPIPQRKATHPTPWEIRKRLQRVPLFQRAKIAEDYVGLEVCWPARLAELIQLHSSKCEVVLRFGDKARSAKIRFVVNVDHCRRLKVLLENDWVLVSGKIASIDDDAIVLQDAAVAFEY